MIGTGAALLGAGLLGAGASIWGANKAADAQSNAAAQAAQANQQALAFQKENYAKSAGNLDPFIKTGQGATGLLGSFYGIGGGDPAVGANALERFRQSPDYQFALKGGGEALDNSLAAKGGALGGNAIRAQTEFGQGLATQNLQNYLSRLSGMAGQGIHAGGYLGSIGTGVGAQVGSTSNNLGNNFMAGGTADASGILGGVKGFQGGLNTLQQYNQMTQSSYGNGSNGYLPTSAGQSGSPFYGPKFGE